MRKIFFLLLPVLSFSQMTEIPSGKIELGESAKNLFIQNGEEFRLNQYEQVFSNAEAIHRIKKAKTNKTFASVLTYVGSFGIGFGAGYALFTKDESEYQFAKNDKKVGWTIAAVGAGITLTSIPLWIGYKNNVKKAVDIENGENQSVSTTFKLNFNGDGMGVVYQF